MAYFINGSNPSNSDFVSSDPLRINSCSSCDGDADGARHPGFLVNRPEGRKDYQLIYIRRGQGKYLLDGRERLLSAGTVLLYKPGVPQVYSYRPEYQYQVSWVHFTGTLARPLMEKCGLYDNPVVQVGDQPEISHLLTRIVREMQRKEPMYQEQATAYFIRLTTLIGRRICQLTDSSGYERAQRIRSVMEYIHEHYDESLNVDSFAQLCALSRHHFIHVFRDYSGQSPYAYLTDVRLTEAARLLTDSLLSVTEVARRCGYDDALYFSRLFKKKYGLSPSAFRRGNAAEGALNESCYH